MDLYILDNLLRNIDVVDVFESIIWTERFREHGDFELVIASTSSNRKRFVENTLLSITSSYRVMRVETIEDTVNDDGRTLLKVRGHEISSLLEGRVALAVYETLFLPSWIINGTPADIMRYMFSAICVDGVVDPHDVIPFLVPDDSLYPTDTIPEPPDMIDWEQKPSSLYAALQELANIYDLGFRLYRDPTVTRLLFNVYAGSDRTTAQVDLPPVVFSADLENILNTTEISTVHETYNVAIVMWIEVIPESGEIPEQIIVHQYMVYADESAPPNEGLDRRVLMVEITSMPEEVIDVDAYLERRGKEELMKVRPLRVLDGEVSQHTQYVYGRDYHLGDLVEMQNLDGATSSMRVEEQIFVQTPEGEKSYPTLMTKQFIHQGTWLSWKYNVPWVDMGATEFWANQE